MARINPSGSDGNFTGAVRLKPVKVKGVPKLVECYGTCGNCGTRTEMKVRPGATVHHWTCKGCKNQIGTSNPYTAPSFN